MILPRSKVITFVFPSKIEKIVYLASLNLLTRIYIQRINERYENLFLTKFFSQISSVVQKFIRFFKFIINAWTLHRRFIESIVLDSFRIIYSFTLRWHLQHPILSQHFSIPRLERTENRLIYNRNKTT